MMDRRNLLLGSLALSASTALPRWAYAQQPAQLPAKIVDVHCHIFNADDLPMVEFVEKSFIRGAPGYKKKIEPYAVVIDALLKNVAEKLRGRAFSAAQESSHLDRIKIDRKNARRPEQIKAAEIRFLTELFENWRNEAPAMPPGIKITHEILSAYVPTIALGYLHREVSPGEYWGPRKFTLGAALYNADHAFTPSRWQESKYLAEQVHLRVPGQLSRAVRWATSYTLYRRELALELHDVNQRRTVLVTPALVDFAKWLDADEKALTPVAKQVDLMERLSRERTPDMPPIHGFVPFDPLRQAIHAKTGGTAAASPFSIVQKAILQQGFIGVKLYPPMGFRPTRNVGIGDDFPCWVRFGKGSPGYEPKCANPTNTSGGLGNTPGQILDDVLWNFFTWCAENDVPLMSHTNNSMSAGPGYGTRANPSYWEKVFQTFPTLRVNMAHFGGFDEAFENQKLHIAAVGKTWEWTVGRMSKANTSLPLYADISYFSEVLAGGQLRKDVLACMKRFKSEFPESDKLLLYGTDWSMIGREQAFGKSYARLVAEFLREAGYDRQEQLDNIFFRNAVRFLGLRTSDREKGTRGRLERFYASPADAAWLSDFDQVS